MSKGLSDTLNIKSLDEILAETEEHNEQGDEVVNPTLPAIPDDGSLMNRSEMTNTSFASEMDEVYTKAMEMADAASDLANNIDPARAPRMFEVAGQQLKIALDASSAKRDAQLKLMKLVQDQRKLELDELKARAELGDETNLQGSVVMVEDRNKLLAQIRAMRAEPSSEPDSDG